MQWKFTHFGEYRPPKYHTKTIIKCNLAWAGKVLNHFQSRFAVFVAVQQLRCSTMAQYHATLVGQYHNYFLLCFGYCATWSLRHWSHPIAKSDSHQLRLWSFSGRCVNLLSGLVNVKGEHGIEMSEKPHLLAWIIDWKTMKARLDPRSATMRLLRSELMISSRLNFFFSGLSSDEVWEVEKSTGRSTENQWNQI